MEFDYKNVPGQCPNVDCGKKKNDCCGITKVVLAAVLGDDSEGSEVAPFNGAYCNKIVEYEANGAIYFYSSDGIYTKLGNKSKGEETASVEYVDSQDRKVLKDAKDYADAGDVATLQLANDQAQVREAQVLQDAKNYADGKDAIIQTNAYSYTDSVSAGVLQDAKDYADNRDAAILQEAKDYTDSAASGVVTKNYVDTGDSNTLASANDYADQLVAGFSGELSDLENSLSTVATSGSYNDLSNKPTIPEIILLPSADDPGEGSPLAANTFIGVYN